MKKVYIIKKENVTADWGRHINDEMIKAVYTEDPTAEVEVLKAEIEKRGAWWMGTGTGKDNRPNVWAEVLEVEGL